MSMNQNVGMTDRIIRIILAVAFTVLALANTAVQSYWWFIPAVVALVTGIVGWCGLYQVFGWSTCPLETKPVKKTVKKTTKKKKK